MFKDIVNRKGNKFYSLDKNAVDRAQEDLGIIIPKELREFYEEIGYGFLNSEEGYYNRIMDPQSLCEFRFREGQFANNPELDIYEGYEQDGLIFFEICEGSYLSIGFSKKNNGKIINEDKIIANSLKEFLIKYQDDERYFD